MQNPYVFTAFYYVPPDLSRVLMHFIRCGFTKQNRCFHQLIVFISQPPESIVFTTISPATSVKSQPNRWQVQAKPLNSQAMVLPSKTTTFHPKPKTMVLPSNSDTVYFVPPQILSGNPTFHLNFYFEYCPLKKEFLAPVKSAPKISQIE